MNKEIQPNYQDGHFQGNTRYLESSDEISLRELFSVIWKGKWLIIAITAVFAIGSVIFALAQPNVYKSEALLAPAEAEGSAGGLAALAGQFGGLASMAGINLDSNGADKTEMAIQVMKSRQFLTNFIEKHGILPELMAAKKWDMHNNQIGYDDKVYDPKGERWVRKVAPPFKSEPSMQEAYKEFLKIFSISKSKTTGMVTVTVKHLSPYVAQQWVEWLIIDINEVMKQRDVEEAIRGQNFLEQQLRKTNVADMRAVLYQLMEQAQKTIMFANVREEYVFKTIDPAVVPEEKSEPKRSLICILGTLFGFVIGLVIVFLKYFLVSKK
ncbi:Wzz/FepE/Etk N-terminal domain-containing protein [Shewanella submarina]|uniref:Wzz/FepE/Etk N-terminal domain-containing protein n=1 Tax=Shewanella submarina TaxID=2016376 RepID=A0ABV7GKN4_9GAMM|nr:Wzz/FepE/Etk N-terminal domain-containing protein [Shewanella submarina]MCL1036531.1 Wzz/FepE/Etk N-terminal domain-containing protein [Shewanella submarina]